MPNEHDENEHDEVPTAVQAAEKNYGRMQRNVNVGNLVKFGTFAALKPKLSENPGLAVTAIMQDLTSNLDELTASVYANALQRDLTANASEQGLRVTPLLENIVNGYTNGYQALKMSGADVNMLVQAARNSGYDGNVPDYLTASGDLKYVDLVKRLNDENPSDEDNLLAQSLGLLEKAMFNSLIYRLEKEQISETFGEMDKRHKQKKQAAEEPQEETEE